MLLSALIGALNGAVAKFLSQSMDPIEIVFYRNLIGVLIVLYSFKNFLYLLIHQNFIYLFLRGSFWALAMVLFFYTIGTIPLGEAVVLNKTSSFFVTILAYYLMKETITLRIFFALIIGFIGIIFIMGTFLELRYLLSIFWEF